MPLKAVMAALPAEAGAGIKIGECCKDVAMWVWKDYMSYIKNWEKNLASLHGNLSDLCDRKDDISKKVDEGEIRLEKITIVAGSWLKRVRKLCQEKKLKYIMSKNVKTAKFVVKMMEKKDLKRSLREERNMQKVVGKVMKKLKEEIENSNMEEIENSNMEEIENKEKMKMTAEEDYKKVVETVVELMMDIVGDFKRLMKKDIKVVKDILNENKLCKLKKIYPEMEEIAREAENVSHEDEGSNAPAMAAKKLITPLGNWLTHLVNLMDDANFRKTVPDDKAELLKSWLDIIGDVWIKTGGLKKETDDNTAEYKGCYYCYRYKMSKAAEKMANLIRNDIMSNCPGDTEILRASTAELEPVPSGFLEGLESRTELVRQILEKLKDDQVDAIGMFGMGGIGKTILAREINNRARDLFDIKVMVELDTDPDIFAIQSIIGEEIQQRLNGIENVARRAQILLNYLNQYYKEKEKKVLIILDNVWKKLNFDKIGISRDACKLLLIARDKDVLRLVDVKDNNMFKVDVMTTNEARDLWKSKIANQDDTKEYKDVVEKILGHCGGLPFAIATRADSLKGKDFLSWKKNADDWDEPISKQRTGDYKDIYSSILETSYEFIPDHNQRIFFLLACLFPLGSSVSIENLKRYCIGLKLFEQADNLTQATEEANTWANELMSSSMLLQDDVKGYVKIHTIMRACAISFAAEAENHNFLVDTIPKWKENFTGYTAMSLRSGNYYSQLDGVEAVKLQILKLEGDLSTSFTGTFFEGMLNLEVLDLSNMNFQTQTQTHLPTSLWKLKKLKTLCMEGCKLGNVTQIGELVNLLVLSLRESSVEELPNEIGKLVRLRLLDLSMCKSKKEPLIPAGVLGRLSQLEGLCCLIDNNQVGFERTSDGEVTSDTEHNSLPSLNTLEIKVAQNDELPFDDQFVQNLKNFRVCIGDKAVKDFRVCVGDTIKSDESIRLLEFNGIDDVGGVLEKNCFKALLKKANCLGITGSKRFEHLFPQLDQQGFRDLNSLQVHGCDDVKWVVKRNGMNGSIPFQRLRSLDLQGLPKLKMVCDSEAPLGTFSNLQTLTLKHLDELEYALPLSLLPSKMINILVDSCKSLNFMFFRNEGTLVTKLPFLKSLRLVHVSNLLSLVGSENFLPISDVSQEPLIFFDGKIVFPSLELLELVGCCNVVELWSKEIHNCGFQNLKNLQIEKCEKLSSVGSPSLFSVLVKLETLTIKQCEQMHEVITLGNTEDTESDGQIIRFPRLKCLELVGLSNLQSFYRKASKLLAPKLQDVTISDCCKMLQFMLGSQDDVIELQSLQKVHIHRCPIMKSIFSGPLKTPKLREVQLYNSGIIEFFLQGNLTHNGDLELKLYFDSVETVDISIQSLSRARLLASKLTHILYGGEKISMLEIGDLTNLNDFLQKRNVIPSVVSEQTNGNAIYTESLSNRPLNMT